MAFAQAGARPEVSSAWLDFRLAVLEAQQSALTRLVQGAFGNPGPARTPRVDVAALDFQEEALVALSEDLVAAARAHGQPGAPLAALQARIGQHAGLGPRIARAAAGADAKALEQLAHEHDVPVDALAFHGRLLAAPFVLRAVVAAVDTHGVGESPATPRCPFCGSAAALATLGREDEGARTLHCGLCGGSWAFTRVACGHCGQQDQRQLALLMIEPTDPAWLETCKACGVALKTFDLRRLPGDLDPLVADAASLHLDLLAAREGFATPPMSAALA
ncbi:MAG: formate dehydrogenase accessory protein FdhE [Pseudomonadota bacterium]